MNSVKAPYLRNQYVNQERGGFNLWRLIAAGLVAGIVAGAMSVSYKERASSYRQLPSADEVLMSTKGSDWQSVQRAAIAREFGIKR